MSKHKGNNIILDISKAQHAVFFYVNQYGQCQMSKPIAHHVTVRGSCFYESELAHHHPAFPGETVGQRAKRLGIIDRWTPTIVFTLASNHTVTYTGKKALSMQKAWNAYIFKRSKTKQKKDNKP